METSIPGDGDRLDSSENPANDYSWTVNDGLSRTEFHLSPDPSPDRGFESDFDLQFNSDDQPTIPFSLEVATREGHCLPAGSLVGPYKIIRRLGQGGMGTVYEATHSQSGQSVALKLVSKSVRSTEELVERFKRESLIAASINHPRSTFVYHSGQHHDQLYIAMELMTGGR